MVWVDMMTGTADMLSIYQPQQNSMRFSDIFKYIWNCFCFDSNFIAVLSQTIQLRIDWVNRLETTGHKPLPKPMKSVILWRHQMETFSALLALCAGNAPITGEFPSQRPVTRSFGVFFDLRLNKRFSKQLWCWWSKTPSCSLWRHCNDTLYIYIHYAIY